MHSVILYCPHLGRDISDLLALVPGARVMTGEPVVPGHDGCLQMHHAAVRMAMAEGWDRVFVMEDDCQFSIRFNFAKWCDDADWAKANGYDVLVGGCVQTYDSKIVRDGLVDVSAFHSAHCIVYLESGYDKVLRTVQPFDVSLGKPGERGMDTEYVGCNIVMAYPFIAVQKPSFSGILQKDVNYVPLYESYEEHLGRALGLRV